MAKKRKLTTVLAVVEAFGGTKAAADWAGIGQSAVSNWIERDLIPPGWHFRMSDYFAGRGVTIDPACFGGPRIQDKARRPPTPTERRVA